jgi:hypothetical protein
VILFTSVFRTHDVGRLDITRAGCDRALRAGKPAPGLFLAPSWELLRQGLAKRRAAKDDAEKAAAWARYAAAYREEMKASYRRHRAAWDALLALDRTVLVCFCSGEDAAEGRCHRFLAAAFLAKCGADYRGELRPEDVIAPPPDVEPPPAVLFGPHNGRCVPFVSTDGQGFGHIRMDRPRPRRCKACGKPAPFLCDFMLKKKTCDAPICEGCAREVRPNLHHCPRHQEQSAAPSGPMPGKGASPQEVLSFRPLAPPGRSA